MKSMVAEEEEIGKGIEQQMVGQITVQEKGKGCVLNQYVYSTQSCYYLRSLSPDANYSSKRPRRGKKDNIDLYDSFSEEDMAGDSSEKKEKEAPAVKNVVDLDLLFLEEDDECLKDTANSAIDRHKPACILLKTGISSGLCGAELYSTVSDIILAHLQSQDDVPDEQVKLALGVFQKNLTGTQAASQLGHFKTRNKLIKDVTLHSKAMTAQVDLSIRNKLRKSSNNQRVLDIHNIIIVIIINSIFSVFRYQVRNCHQTGTQNSTPLG